MWYNKFNCISKKKIGFFFSGGNFDEFSTQNIKKIRFFLTKNLLLNIKKAFYLYYIV